MRNATLEIIQEILNEWREKIEGLEGKFHLPIFDVTILGDRREGAQRNAGPKGMQNEEDVIAGRDWGLSPVNRLRDPVSALLRRGNGKPDRCSLSCSSELSADRHKPGTQMRSKPRFRRCALNRERGMSLRSYYRAERSL
jgi:hypothetical protein